MCTVKLVNEEDKSEDKLLNTRRLTVQRVILEGRYSPNDYSSKILLQGKWVLNCGFEPDDKLTVSVYKGRIVIEKEKPGTIDTALLARVEKENGLTLRKRVKAMVPPEVFEQLSFKNGKIRVKVTSKNI